MEESFAKRYWQTNGNWGLEANTGMHFNFFSSSFHRVQIYTLVQRDRKTHLFRGRGIHTGAHAQHTTHSKRTQKMLQVLIYIQWKCLFILAVISLWLLIPMCLCAQVWIVLFVSDLVLQRYLMCKNWNLFVPVWECGYVFGLPSLGEQTAASAGRPPQREQLWWLSIQLIFSLFHFFPIWQPNTINYSTW